MKDVGKSMRRELKSWRSQRQSIHTLRLTKKKINLQYWRLKNQIREKNDD